MLALLSILLLSHVQSCDDKTQYLKDEICCKKCKPGEYLIQKCRQGKTDTQCGACSNGFFTDDYNVQYNWCNHCTTCNKDHMKTEKNCTAKSDAVCTCDEGYRCTDSKCQACEKIQTTTVSTPLSTKTISPNHDTHDQVDGSCQHQPVSAAPSKATLDPVSAQRKRRYQCQCRRCVERLKNWRMSEKRVGRRPLMRLWIEYLL